MILDFHARVNASFLSKFLFFLSFISKNSPLRGIEPEAVSNRLSLDKHGASSCLFLLTRRFPSINRGRAKILTVFGFVDGRVHFQLFNFDVKPAPSERVYINSTVPFRATRNR